MPNGCQRRFRIPQISEKEADRFRLTSPPLGYFYAFFLCFGVLLRVLAQRKAQANRLCFSLVHVEQYGIEPRKGGRRKEKANCLAFSGERRGGFADAEKIPYAPPHSDSKMDTIIHILLSFFMPFFPLFSLTFYRGWVHPLF